MKALLDKQEGFSLLEVLVSIFILSLVVGPFISLFVLSVRDYKGAGERTRDVYVAQGLMESLLDPDLDLPFTTEDFQEHPQLSQYEYRIIVMPHQGASLQEITVELRERENPEKVTSLVTLKGRRKTYGTSWK